MANERYLEIALRLFPKIQKRDGVPEGELKAAEKRLGFPLPAELRAMYRLCGRRHDLHEGHDRLVLPNNLIVVNKALIFYEENERKSAWAIRLADRELEDPPVVCAKNEPPYTWEDDHDELGQFFVTELLWQHVHSEPHAVVPASSALLTRLRARYEEVPLPGCHWDMLGCFGSEGTIIMARGRSADDGAIYLGATSDDELAHVMELTGTAR